jgi:hypothetical protein
MLIAAVSAFALTACLETLPDHVDLSPQAEDVEIASDPPNADQYSDIGEVEGEGAGFTADVATRNARHDLRNHAALMGARFVAVEDVSSDSVGIFTGKARVTLHGIAYQLRE